MWAHLQVATLSKIICMQVIGGVYGSSTSSPPNSLRILYYYTNYRLPPLVPGFPIPKIGYVSTIFVLLKVSNPFQQPPRFCLIYILQTAPLQWQSFLPKNSVVVGFSTPKIGSASTVFVLFLVPRSLLIGSRILYYYGYYRLPLQCYCFLTQNRVGEQYFLYLFQSLDPTNSLRILYNYSYQWVPVTFGHCKVPQK